MNRKRNIRKLPSWVLVMAVLIWAMAASLCSAMVVPVTGVTTDNPPGSPPYHLQSIIVGDYTVDVSRLASGTSTTTLDPVNGTALPVQDDLEIGLQYNAAESGDAYTVYMFGGRLWKNSNGNNPDFFLFEGGDGDAASLAAILPGGQVGQSITLPDNWGGDTGYDSSLNGQNIEGIAFAITDLLDAAGNPLTNSSVIEGLAITARNGLDPSDWCAVVPPLTLALDPIPADEAIDVLRDVILGWQPAELAKTHNVYFGTVFDDVNNASVATASGLDANSFDPGRMELGQTYYWRIDEVNGAPDRTVFKGNVWSFTVEPYSIQIPGSAIAVSASSTSNEFSTPERTIDGSGLGADDSHGTSAETMWFTASVDLDPWIQYDFDGVKKLDTMKVWNSNGAAESAIGWGVKDVIIEYSVDGENWDVLESANQFSRAPGLLSYNQPDEIAFGGVAAKQVRLNIQSNWGGILMSYGISEAQFYIIPAEARTPNPASGSVDILPNALATWRAGREAGQHTVYVSTDASAVADGLAPSVSSSTNSIDLSLLDLQLGETYYWRVDEVNESEAVSVWAGPVWSLSIVDTVTVDDFERYSNASPDRPFQAWLDGFGYSADEFFPAGFGGNGTGAGIGHDIWSLSSPHYNGGVMETSNTIAGSGQSMPFYYSNSGGVASETQHKFAVPQNWTLGGAQTLVVHFFGAPENTGELYVKLNNGTKVTYNGQASAISTPYWTQWNIDLSSLGVNLQSVTQLSIGVEGGSGLLYIDDILLYRVAPELPDQILLEAEAASVMGASWRHYDDPASSGGKHIGSEEGDGDDNTVAPGAEWIATYNFNAVGGVYKVLLRGQEADSDSFWVRITTASSQTHENPDQVGTGWVRFNGLDAPNGWAWDEVHSDDHSQAVVNWTLAPGAHTLEIGKREDGVLLDAIVITDDVD